jgi:predicted GNAT family acetyltransferase
MSAHISAIFKEAARRLVLGRRFLGQPGIFTFMSNKVVREESSDSEGKFVYYDPEQGVAAAYVTYKKVNGALDLEHTVTDPQFRGKGLAEIVVRAAFDWGEKENYKLIPTCTYISGSFLKKNPNYLAQCKL